jgi:hypothetical protein
VAPDGCSKKEVVWADHISDDGLMPPGAHMAIYIRNVRSEIRMGWNVTFNVTSIVQPQFLTSCLGEDAVLSCPRHYEPGRISIGTETWTVLGGKHVRSLQA